MLRLQGRGTYFEINFIEETKRDVLDVGRTQSELCPLPDVYQLQSLSNPDSSSVKWVDGEVRSKEFTM
jgi:hypothetical protein